MAKAVIVVTVVFGLEPAHIVENAVKRKPGKHFRNDMKHIFLLVRPVGTDVDIPVVIYHAPRGVPKGPVRMFFIHRLTHFGKIGTGHDTDTRLMAFADDCREAVSLKVFVDRLILKLARIVCDNPRSVKQYHGRVKGL